MCKLVFSSIVIEVKNQEIKVKKLGLKQLEVNNSVFITNQNRFTFVSWP